MSADAGSIHNSTAGRLVERARTHSAELRRRAGDVEANRKLPQDIADKLAADGLYAMCNPPDAGGCGATPGEYAEVVETLARSDASPAWCAFIATTAAYAMATRRTQSITTLLNEPGVITAGVFAPMGRAKPARKDGTDGFMINGRWAWGSNAQNASWIMAGCLLCDEGGAVVTGESGKPQHLSPIFAAADAEFIDTWTVSGLQGTGSTDFQVTDVFVPEDRIVRDFDNARDDLPIFRFPGFGLLAMGIAAVALGTARGAMDDFHDIAGGKIPSGARNPLAAKSMVQRDVARAEAAIRQGRAFFHESIEAAWSASQDGPVSLDLRRDLRLACIAAVQSSKMAVDLIYELAGGTAVYRTSPIQRRFRDIHVMTQHIMVQQGIYELTGRMLLDQPTDTGML